MSGQGELLPREPDRGQATSSARGWAPRNEREFVDSFMYLLTAPVLVWPGWEDGYRQHRDRVTIQRLLHHREIFAEGQCTEFEAMLYVSSVSLAHPLPRSWANIYFWLFRRWSPEAADQVEVPGGDLDPHEREELAKVRRWIFKRQMLHLRERRGEDTSRMQREVEAEQPRLL